MAKKQDHAQKQPAPDRLPPTTKKHWLNEGITTAKRDESPIFCCSRPTPFSILILTDGRSSIILDTIIMDERPL